MGESKDRMNKKSEENARTDSTSHPLRKIWPEFLDLMDSNPNEAWAGLHEFTWRLLTSNPPSALRALSLEEREDFIATLVIWLHENDFCQLRKYHNMNRPFAGWLAKTAQLRALSQLKGLQKERSRSVSVDDESPTASYPQLPSSDPPADERILYGDTLSALWRHIRELDESCQSLLDLAGQGLRPQEIAQVLALPKGGNKQVSDNLRYLRRNLRTKLKRKGLWPWL